MRGTDDSFSRTPPHDIDAEKAVLGAILLDNLALGAVLEVIEAGDFYPDRHRKIFSGIVELSDKGVPADIVTLSSALRDKGQLEKTGGTAYLCELADGLASAANVGHYARIVKQTSIERAVIGAAVKMIDSVYARGKSAAETINEAQQAILSLAVEGKSSRVRSAREVARRTYNLIEKRSKRKGGLTGLSTGLRKLDELTLGLQNGELFIVAARPSQGKTALAIFIIRHVAQTGVPVYFLSAEMPSETIMTRMLSSATGIDSHQLRRGAIFGTAWDRLVKAADAIGSLPLDIDDGSNVPLAELRGTVRRAKAEQGIGLLVVDYMQLLRSGGRNETREREVSEISRTLKEIARELDIPVIGLSQLNRMIENRKPGTPQLSDLRESGSIEQDADVVAFISIDKDAGTSEINIAKHRNGPTGTIRLWFDVRTQTFSDNPRATS